MRSIVAGVIVTTAVLTAGCSIKVGVAGDVPSRVVNHETENHQYAGHAAHRKKAEVRPAYLGVYFREISSGRARRLGVSRRAGLYVQDVVRGAPADEAGILPKDIVISIDGFPVRRMREFRRLMRGPIEPGQLVSVIVLRGPSVAREEHVFAVCMGESARRR